MKKLIKGIIKFRQTSIEEYRSKFAKLAFTQNPDAGESVKVCKQLLKNLKLNS